MYKIPQNNNRARSLRNKFENLEKNNAETAQNGCGNNLTKNFTFSLFYFRKYTILLYIFMLSLTFIIIFLGP